MEAAHPGIGPRNGPAKRQAPPLGPIPHGQLELDGCTRDPLASGAGDMTGSWGSLTRSVPSLRSNESRRWYVGEERTIASMRWVWSRDSASAPRTWLECGSVPNST